MTKWRGDEVAGWFVIIALVVVLGLCAAGANYLFF